MKNWKRYTGLLVFVIGLSYREIQILIDRGSWNREDFWIPIWYTKLTTIWKNFDSFHFIHGLAILGLAEYLVQDLPTYYFTFLADWINYQLYVAAYWFIFMQIRNLFMHKIFKKGKK